MAAIDQTKDRDKDICWARGDNDPKVFTINLDGVATDISLWTLSMAVNTIQDPPDVTTEIFVIAGVFVTDGTDGLVSFTPPPTSLDAVAAPSRAFYDINRVTPSKKTLIKGRVEFIMDVDKG